jgi:protoporphyrinogen oxidase
VGHSREKCDILVIGAGPAGLGAADRLEASGADWLLVEKEARVGGLAGSFEQEGFTWDIGGHVIFSHYPEYDRMLDRVIPPNEWVWHDRRSAVCVDGTWVPYPFQANVHALPPDKMWACVEGVLDLYARQVPPDRTNFQKFIDTHFGNGIAETFMNPYNFKVWGYPLENLSTDWVAERVQRVRLEQIVRSAVFKQDETSWGSNIRFRFPLRGGTGEIWRRLADELPSERLRLRAEVVRISLEGSFVELASGEQIHYDHAVSTIPLDRIADMSDNSKAGALARELSFSGIHAVGIGMRGSPPEAIEDYCWIYFPTADCPFYRATLFSNYSSCNAPEGHWSLLLEVCESPHKPVDPRTVVQDCIDGCRAVGLLRQTDSVLSRWTIHVKHAYPTPTIGRDDMLHEVLDALESHNVYSRGRFGLWRYEVGNMDHCFAQGLEVVDRILNGQEETTCRKRNAPHSTSAARTSTERAVRRSEGGERAAD